MKYGHGKWKEDRKVEEEEIQGEGTVGEEVYDFHRTSMPHKGGTKMKRKKDREKTHTEDMHQEETLKR